jgi:hypothetical protein
MVFRLPSKLKTSKFLHHVWILDVRSGVCIFEQHYTINHIDSDLVSGFLTAMRNFGQEITNSLMEEISFQNLKFSMGISKTIMLVCGLSEQATRAGARDLIDVIMFEFEHRYGNALDHFMGNCSVFTEFGIFLENLLNKSPIQKQAPPNKEIKPERKLELDADKKQVIIEETEKNVTDEQDKTQAIDGLIRKIQRKQKLSKLSLWFSLQMERKFINEFRHPEPLIQIAKNRENMRAQRHASIEAHMRYVRKNLDKEIQHIIHLPPKQLQNMVGFKEREELRSENRFDRLRKKEIQNTKNKIEKHQREILKHSKIIEQLQDKMAELS